MQLTNKKNKNKKNKNKNKKKKNILKIDHIYQVDKVGSNLPCCIFALMVIFGHAVFYLFGPLVINLAIQFSFYSAFRIRPSVPVRFIINHAHIYYGIDFIATQSRLYVLVEPWSTAGISLLGLYAT